MSKNTKAIIIIVGLGQYINAANRLKRQINKLNLIDNIVLINNNELIQILKNESIDLKFFNEKIRGFGYWMWKPVIINYFINKSFERVIYLDAGSEIINEPFKNIYKWFNDCKYNMIISPAGQKMENYLFMVRPLGVNGFISIANEYIDV